MAKGDGGLIERSRGVWEVQLSLGNDPITGKRRRVYRTVRGTKADARKVRDQLRREHESGLKVDSDRVTFSQFAETWTESRKISGSANEKTIMADKRKLDYMAQFVGDAPLKDIDAQTVEALYTAVRDAKHKEGRSFGGASMRKLHVLLKGMFKKAVDYDLILRNPCDRVTAPKAEEPERRALTALEASRLLGCIDGAEKAAYGDMEAKEQRQTERGNLFDRSYLRGLNTISCTLAVRIGLATGMRLGEVMGLAWEGVNLEAREIRVYQSLTPKGELKEPKSKAGRRSIAIDGETAARLAVWKRQQAVHLLKLRIKQDGAMPVCCSERGTFLDLSNFSHWWKNFREANGFEGLKFHELRHTQATQLLANGVDVKTVQTRLGHSNASLTLNWYAHALPENDRKAAALVGELFAPKEEEEKPRIIDIRTA